MTQRYRVKTYVEDAYYHVFNRGVEKRTIFEDDNDYSLYLHLLKYYLSPENQGLFHPSENYATYNIIRPRPLTNLSNEIDLLAYCLMPNHFHLLIKQKTKNGMTKLLRSISTTYAMYFNKKYDRVGPLFQGRYKAALVDNDNYLIHISRYIHLNPLDLALTGTDPVNYPYSSFAYYVGKKQADWLKPNKVLELFKKDGLFPSMFKYRSYDNFFVKDITDSKEKIGTLSID
ncbi:hypothetical protein A3A76_00025 [Candidatus Woesebacteria bacterium RIFCSPLOWO2_01_FULL_39_23]|uniref:Transposase IS200-like domain-containing protein n=1 Tax=Candidatus Woesebacteria bacterium RIFCSPHIGHO2_01_FULL_40_22 TaxID=1802499 RepID=A0A1F7YG11_9BACT|nr:MAG: hypothetical protein A2141_03125 [Candidatus Woesebacteria bacterium RBG_16_40_11]OGM26271.1 MAG: hypothetical protein A2628_03645 [Candidatus Woesebacteria bacterium RIFCSPHIGHO2_01_FULL_40_22]OGM36639.1 MAG: hypothetical protein A3E41_01870 [Candidatus Woesebacteria bacterium RIFCSPHIGHO2_12_FULL_38_9]OGM62826.1 MAG: hypothetical protein A3A76_00025 [Candidatus Woesebacteria bacterium RIFCSPLOWO2_01_FULL_39_23]